MRYLANGITLSRIFLACILWFVDPLSVGFYMLYIGCGLSDILDGYIARKTKTESHLGERLDSIADLVMVIIVIVRVYPVIQLPEEAYYWIGLIILIRCTSLVVVLMKYKTFGILHTYGNKITGLALFIAPLFLLVVPIEGLTYILCLLGTLSAFEELVIHFKGDELDLNRKGLFFR
jgi:CDP-diacylglycerol--glycerol-3-phosphate 3-phosphatidyltransferase